ncbi:PQQ-binding-like beta-propeller repeat protein, partial [Candidatus Omnitrophota bacterium]
PAVWKSRVFAVSDDGYLYCLSAQDGDVIWKKRGGPEEDMVIGNDRMVSRWPARGGVVIKDDILYFGAGIWPSHGIFIYALDPKNGTILWVNDDSGGLEWDQPHGLARAKSGISCQGYLCATGKRLLVPTGRAVPAALDLESGKLEYFHLQQNRTQGGSSIIATDDYFFVTSGHLKAGNSPSGKRHALYNSQDGKLLITGESPNRPPTNTNSYFNFLEQLSFNELDSPVLAITPDYIWYSDFRDYQLKALGRNHFLSEQERPGQRGETVKETVLSPPVLSIDTHEKEAVSLIAAGSAVVMGTVNKRVVIIDVVKKSVLWSIHVDGIPYGLAVAHGRLYVSTDKGTLYCFDDSGTSKPQVIRKEPVNFPYGGNIAYADAAELISRSGITEGYCLDLGCGDGRLAYELAQQTNLQIYAVDPDLKNVMKARRNLEKAGLYGHRVTVHQGSLSASSYPDYFANLIVSGRSVTEGISAIDKEAMARLLRPYGGIACLGGIDSIEKTVSGSLAGAGKWTHQYSNAANTINSGDELIKAPLGILWWRDSDFDMPSRHGRGVGPLFSEGRLFVQGNNSIRAYDAYNGHVIWERDFLDLMKAYDQDHLLGVAITQGNWCVEGNRIFVRTGIMQEGTMSHRMCQVLDTSTGNLINQFQVPEWPGGIELKSWSYKKTGYWGYIAVEDGTIYGTIVQADHYPQSAFLDADMSQLFSESKVLFAMDADTGEVKWMYTAEHSIRHNTIAIGNGRVYLIDRAIAGQDRIFSKISSDTVKSHRSGKLVALNARTGEEVYQKSNDIYGTLLALTTEQDVLVMTYQVSRFQMPSEVGGRMSAFRASDGKRLWDITTDIVENNKDYIYRSRPIINDSTIYFEPYAFDLTTGKKLDFNFSRTYNCGIIAGSSDLMVYRSGTLGYLDVNEPGNGTQDFGGIRPGCWINTIPAGGIVMMPDATARCTCSYLMKATIALKSF